MLKNRKHKYSHLSKKSLDIPYDFQVFNRPLKVINNYQNSVKFSFTIRHAKLFLLTRNNTSKQIITKTIINHGINTGRHL